MGKAIIEITDEEDDQIRIRLTFDPEIDRGPGTPAQHAAVTMIDLYREQALSEPGPDEETIPMAY